MKRQSKVHKVRKTLLSGAILLFSIASCKNDKAIEEKHDKIKKAKNVILLIGDGMGLSQISSSFYFNDQPSNFPRFKHIGLIRTSSSSHKITDSAAGATAFSTGKKSYNGAIGVDPDTSKVETIMEILNEEYVTGLVATSSITHATPASFYAHVKLRGMQEEIARQLVYSPVDFFAGGGQKFFAHRRDQVNYLDSLTAQGFKIDTTSLGASSELSSENKYGYLLANDGMPKMLEGRGNFLVDASKLALDYLTMDDRQFYLMIEGSQIDWGGHSNDADYLISEMIDFDKAVGLALDFAEKDQNTLVIVTADHETGGFTLSSKDGNYDEIDGTFSTGGHSTTLIPVFAYGPGSENFIGIYENNEIFHRVNSAMGIE
ncbi:alkaline phosphatase [Fulvivirgaceae bacterium BMA10]|uniref:Alkaline phosphatase n=1 Tax=Splendidivirga corallicola TaxID=3051826 RepID=A0ABT8KIK8_9BACT|nr:alkaline phosphatase [Fulvivirgaceae bacterium BMA10]